MWEGLNITLLWLSPGCNCHENSLATDVLGASGAGPSEPLGPVQFFQQNGAFAKGGVLFRHITGWEFGSGTILSISLRNGI